MFVSLIDVVVFDDVDSVEFRSPLKKCAKQQEKMLFTLVLLMVQKSQTTPWDVQKPSKWDTLPTSTD